MDDWSSLLIAKAEQLNQKFGVGTDSSCLIYATRLYAVIWSLPTFANRLNEWSLRPPAGARNTW